MKLIKPSFKIWNQPAGPEGVYKQVEKVGRVCYKSEDKMTEDSAKPFVDRMIKSGHGAMLEHGTVYLMKESEFINIHIHPEEGEEQEYDSLFKYYDNPYSYVVEKDNIAYITTNLRVLVENGWLDDLKYLCEPTGFHEKRITVHFVCDRGISHEFVRHRVFSFAQESTRYCNYSKDKFGKECTFIIPSWSDIPEGEAYFHDGINFRVGANEGDIFGESVNPRAWAGNNNWKEVDSFLHALEIAENQYFDLLNLGWIAQQARVVLPNSLKTELVMTGFVDDWWGEYLVIDKSTGLIDQRVHGKFYDELNNIDRDKYRVVEKGFFPLRCSSGAHPQAQELAIPLREEFVKRRIF